jgi:hypothetical protein
MSIRATRGCSLGACRAAVGPFVAYHSTTISDRAQQQHSSTAPTID